MNYKVDLRWSNIQVVAMFNVLDIIVEPEWKYFKSIVEKFLYKSSPNKYLLTFWTNFGNNFPSSGHPFVQYITVLYLKVVPAEKIVHA